MTLTHNSSTIAQALSCSIGGIPGRPGTLQTTGGQLFLRQKKQEKNVKKKKVTETNHYVI